jgi:endonuclease/exonuclease/phosphatase family metal-dependent hydrolase
MSYNIRHGMGNDGSVDLERIAGVISAWDPDVVALQEVDVLNRRSGNSHQPLDLGARLGLHAVFGCNARWADDESGPAAQYGTAILTRWEIVDWSNIPYPRHEGWEPRGLLRCVIRSPEVGTVVVYNTHLQVGDEANEDIAAAHRSEATAMLMGRVKDEAHPVVLLGDFNALPGSGELQTLGDGPKPLRDAWHAAGNDPKAGYTFPSSPNAGAMRIDAIFLSPEWAVSSCWVVTNGVARMASDHLPVAADLVLA